MIKGISIGKEETKLDLPYADDTTAVLSDRDSVHALFNLLDVFRKLSGLKINTSKTEGTRVEITSQNPFVFKCPYHQNFLFSYLIPHFMQ